MAVLERESVEGYRALALRLVQERRDLGLTLRQLTAASGVALSVLTGVEQGSSWPRFRTVSGLAGALGLRVQVAGERTQVAGAERTDPDLAIRRLMEKGYTVIDAWEAVLIDELRRRIIPSGRSKTALAGRIHLRHNTVTEFLQLELRNADVSMRTVCAMAAYLGARVEAVSIGDPWG